MAPIHTKEAVIRYIEKQADNLKIRGYHGSANELASLANAVSAGWLPNRRQDALHPSYWMEARPSIDVVRCLFPKCHIIWRTARPNPKRPGKPRHRRVEMYRTGETVGDFLASGGEHLDLWWDVRDGIIEVFNPADSTTETI